MFFACSDGIRSSVSVEKSGVIMSFIFMPQMRLPSVIELTCCEKYRYMSPLEVMNGLTSIAGQMP